MEIPTLMAAFVAGLVTGVHCAGMCGPLACAVVPADPGGGWSSVAGPFAYHGMRTVAYAFVGAMAGLLGMGPLAMMDASPVHMLSWALVLVFVLLAMGIEQRLPRPAFLNKWLFRMKLVAGGRGPVARGVMLGAVTPLLPCGPLYLLFMASLASGSATRGAEFAAAFALGTIPLLFLAQAGWGGLRKKLTPARLRQVQRGMALVAALALVWRLRGDLPWVEVMGPGCGCEGGF
jgi:uncharacterized protein